jgi:hypothetical protein
MGYNSSPIDTAAYATQVRANMYRGTDGKWYDVRAYQRGGAEQASKAQLEQFSQQEVAAAQAEADNALNVANATRDREYQSMLEIQRQTQAQTASQEADRAAAQEAAAQKQREADAAAEAGRQQAALTAANQKTDLTSENVVNIVAGATADQASAADTQLKKQRGVGIASRVGINV